MSKVPDTIKLVLEGAVDASVVLDEDRKILHYNRAYEALSGLRGRQLSQRVEAGARCYEIFPLEICESQCLGCKAFEVNRALRVDEITAKRADGEELTFIVSAVPVGDGVVVESYRDVTADVRIQRQYKVLLDNARQHNELLEEKVREAKEELTRAQAALIHQEKMGALGRLVAGVAHELNNPINFVYGNVDFLGQYMSDLLDLVKLIDESELPPDLREQFEEKKEDIEYDFMVTDSQKLIRSIRAGAERTASIVQDLKNHSRSGGIGELQEVDVVAGIDTTLNLLAALLKNRIEVRRHIKGKLPRLYCNAGHINQVFMNILTNAAQAISGEGTIDVTIETIDEGKSIQVAIADSGPGIPEDVMEKMTDPFYTTKEVGEGTGLGLWISENIVHAHGGSMTCESEPGNGATFTIRLPVRAPDTARMGIMSEHRMSIASKSAAAAVRAQSKPPDVGRATPADIAKMAKASAAAVAAKRSESSGPTESGES